MLVFLVPCLSRPFASGDPSWSVFVLRGRGDRAVALNDRCCAPVCLLFAFARPFRPLTGRHRVPLPRCRPLRAILRACAVSRWCVSLDCRKDSPTPPSCLPQLQARYPLAAGLRSKAVLDGRAKHGPILFLSEVISRLRCSRRNCCRQRLPRDRSTAPVSLISSPAHSSSSSARR